MMFQRLTLNANFVCCASRNERSLCKMYQILKLAALIHFHIGALSCWNHPFEVARIQMQSAASAGEKEHSMIHVLRTIAKEEGIAGWFKGVIPRLGLGIWQTLFMVTGAKLVKQALENK